MSTQVITYGNPLATIKAMRFIADLPYTSGMYRGAGNEDKNLPWLEDWRNQHVNAVYEQTTGGLFIEQSYGRPGAIWTPWGNWNCWGSGMNCTDAAMQHFLDLIGEVQVFSEVKHTHMGTVGPIYAVIKAGDIVLPYPELRKRGQFLSYDEANRQWDQLVKIGIT